MACPDSASWLCAIVSIRLCAVAVAVGVVAVIAPPSATNSAPSSRHSTDVVRTSSTTTGSAPKFRSNVWAIFRAEDEVDAEGTVVHARLSCRHCSYVGTVLKSGDSAGSVNISGLRRHCTSAHPAEYAALLADEADKSGATVQPKAASASNTATVDGASDNVTVAALPLLARAVISSGWAMTLVENADVRRFLHALNPNFRIPSRPTLLRNAILDVATEEEAHVRAKIASASALALTVDLGTNARRLGVIVVTATGVS
jgi:hypothetical protein